ncbi:MAG: AraC family transcriptional regulator ligand-binding domain-containing protein [Nocardioides sp.]
MLEEPAARHWDFPRAVAGVARLVEHARAHGLAVADALAGSGLDPADLEHPEREVTAAQELRVVRTLLGHLAGRDGAEGAGLALGATYHVSTFGIFGYALLASRSVLDAINVALRFLDLSFTFAMPTARVDDGTVVVDVDGSTLPADVRRFLVERDASAMATVLGELVPGGVGARLEAGPTSARITFPASVLDRPLPQANPQTVAVCEALCRDVVARRRERTGLAREVRVLVAQALPTGAPMAGTAAALGLSERTLRRRLGEEGVRYQQLVDEVRESLARELLGTGLLVEDVAQRLGYAEASSFIHAFRRWTGRTPAAYRALDG